MSQEETTKIRNSLSRLPLNQIVITHGISWLQMKGIFSKYSFDGFDDYNTIAIRAPYFTDHEKAYN